MRSASIIALIAAIVLIPVACSPPDPNDEDQIRHRALLARSCPNGLLVGYDPVTHRLTWETNWKGGLVAPGVSVDQVCEQQGGER